MEAISVETIKWVMVAKEEDVPANGGSCVMYKNEQIAIFNFKKEMNGMQHRICARIKTNDSIKRNDWR